MRASFKGSQDPESNALDHLAVVATPRTYNMPFSAAHQAPPPSAVRVSRHGRNTAAARTRGTAVDTRSHQPVRWATQKNPRERTRHTHPHTHTYTHIHYRYYKLSVAHFQVKTIVPPLTTSRLEKVIRRATVVSTPRFINKII